MCFNASYATRHKFCLSGYQIWPHTEQHIKHVIPRNQTYTHIHSFNPLNPKVYCTFPAKSRGEIAWFWIPSHPLLTDVWCSRHPHQIRRCSARSAAGKGSSRMPPPKRNISWFRTRRLTVRFMVDILPLDVFINQIIHEDPYMPLLFAYPNTMLLVGWAHRCEAVSEHLR